MKKPKNKKTRKKGEISPAPAPDQAAIPAGQAPAFDSIAAAAAGLGIPKAKLRQFKREGAPGFRGSRVYGPELLAWIKSQGADAATAAGVVAKDALECRKLAAQAERIEYENNVRYGHFVARVDVAKHLKMFGAEISQARNEFRNSFPALVVSKPIEEIRAACDKAWDAIFLKFKNHFQQWTI